MSLNEKIKKSELNKILNQEPNSNSNFYSVNLTDENLLQNQIKNSKKDTIIMSYGCSLTDFIIDTSNISLLESINYDTISKYINQEKKDLKGKELLDYYFNLLNERDDRENLSNPKCVESLKNFIFDNLHLIQLGGSTCNTTRLVCKLSNKNGVFIGTISDCKMSKFYEKKLREERIELKAYVVANSNMSYCIPFIINKDKYFYNDLKTNKIMNLDEIKSLINSINLEEYINLQFFMTDSYLIDTHKEIFQYIFEEMTKLKEKNKKKPLIVYNIASVYFYTLNSNFINEMISKYVDILIFNEDELNEINKLQFRNVDNINSKSESKENNNLNLNENELNENDFFKEIHKFFVNPKMYICTRGSKSSILYVNEKEIDRVVYLRDNIYDNKVNFNNDWNFYEQNVDKINEEEIVDCNGAGDSFSAGFLNEFYNQYSNNEKIDYNKCLKVANFYGRESLKYKGFQIPNL